MSELELCEAMAIGAKSVNLESNLILLGEWELVTPQFHPH